MDIREKAVISNHANTGAYGFASTQLLQRCCEDEINSNLSRNVTKDGQEWYLSNLIRYAVIFATMWTDRLLCWG